MLELCKTHKLVLANDGRCVLCRRPQRELTPRESVLSRLLTFMLGMCLLAAMFELAAMARKPPLNSSSERGFGEEGDTITAGEAAGAIERVGPKPEAGEAAAAQASAGDAADATAASTDDDKSAAPEHTVLFPRGDAASTPAGAGVAVTMYSAPWCFICDQAREFLAYRGVALTEIDIERDRANLRRLGKLNKSQTIPTFEIEGQAYVGFDRRQLDEQIREAAAQRYAATKTELTRHR
jgi:glutaredoxin